MHKCGQRARCCNSIPRSAISRHQPNGSHLCRRVEHLAWHPRAWLYHNFLTAEEADHLIELAAPSMARSTVVDSETGDSVLDPIRTSQGTFLT